jgi:hypothetical protein
MGLEFMGMVVVYVVMSISLMILGRKRTMPTVKADVGTPDFPNKQGEQIRLTGK